MKVIIQVKCFPESIKIIFVNLFSVKFVILYFSGKFEENNVEVNKLVFPESLKQFFAFPEKSCKSSSL